jgi:hypothetical protein
MLHFPAPVVHISATHDSLVTKSAAKSGVDSYPRGVTNSLNEMVIERTEK